MSQAAMDLPALLLQSGLEDAYLATLDDLTSEALWAEVRRHVGKVPIATALILEAPLHEHVKLLGKRRRIQLSTMQHLTKCGLIPGRDYRDYTVYGAVLPPADRYDSICSRCWRSRSAFEAEGQLSAAEPGTASSSGESDPEVVVA